MSDTFEFIDAEYATTLTQNTTEAPPITKMCGWLNVSRSGYYEWRKRPESATARRCDELRSLIRRSFEASDGTYGYRRVHADLADWGVACGLELVRALMRELGLEPCQPKPWRHSLTEAADLPHAIPDLLARDFTADAPGKKMIGDVTYIPTWQGWLFLATVIDCHTREVIGWAMDDHYRTPLLETAIRMAVGNGRVEQGAMFHSDRGSNYTSSRFGAALKQLRIRQSVGRTGICYDNAMAESFFATLKKERVHRTAYPTREHARNDIARYIELRYNSRRRHSKLGYRTPRRVRIDFENRQLTA